MEKTIKMYRLTENGAKVIKDVPKNLYSQYLLIGYVDYIKEEPIKKIEEVKEEKKVEPKVNNKKGNKFKIEF